MFGLHNQAEIERILAQAATESLPYDSAVNLAQQHQLSFAEFADGIALAIAIGYRQHRYPFEFADGVANWLFGFMTSEVFLSANQNTLPELAAEVYDAFDCGEYLREQDGDEIDPAEKYTRPRIEAILAAR
ncbi:hypothetical protein [Ferrimonas aestuarii]|uniref:Uncharacterized protein n=1 Tax=Ferrimonas aestuarii TaxID=2569539 RepID=A0A4U1BHR2_9GAMM|nr:hypothetical protein [Ferrimonas aestuarii]TKB50037.1 hypothetical protein FCL42_19835 [Ferrimonas aestuarii]